MDENNNLMAVLNKVDKKYHWCGKSGNFEGFGIFLVVFNYCSLKREREIVKQY